MSCVGHGVRTVPEQAPRGSHERVAERAIQRIEEQVRVIKIARQKLGVAVPTGHPISSWTVQYSAGVINKMEVGHDGRTAWERHHGRPYTGELLEFGSEVYWKCPQRRGGLMEPRWGTGVWPGKRGNVRGALRWPSR